MAVVERRVTRADIEAKLAEIQGEMEAEGEKAKGIGIAVGAVVVVGVVVGAFLWGKRRGKKDRALIEIRRV